jgi:signal transduction histidine kinase
MHMSHDMLTPMNTIIGMSKMLKAASLTDEAKNYTDEISDASDNLLRLINDLLDLSGKIEGTFVLSESELNLEQINRGVINLLEPDLQKKHQALVYSIEPALRDITLLGDENRISQVINNILVNAIKYTPNNGEIVFSTSIVSEDNASVTVQMDIEDNGIGISKERQGIIFSIFELGHAVDDISMDSRGIGLGLPLAKRIIDMMGGKIWVESDLDMGSKFSFTFTLYKI